MPADIRGDQMKTKLIGKNSGIPILIGHQTIELEGHTEILSALRMFDGSSPQAVGPGRPEAALHMDSLRPRPMAALGSQPFKHIKDEHVQKLFRRWGRQLDKLAKKSRG